MRRRDAATVVESESTRGMWAYRVSTRQNTDGLGWAGRVEYCVLHSRSSCPRLWMSGIRYRIAMGGASWTYGW